MNKKKENETAYMNNELKNLKKIMNSYEDQSDKITELENKLKLQKNSYSRKIKELEDIYLLEISELNKKISSIESSEFNTTKRPKFSTNKTNSKTKKEFCYDYVINNFFPLYY